MKQIYDNHVLNSDFFFFKQKTAYEMRISDWSSDVCSSDLYDYWGDTMNIASRLQHAAPPGGIAVSEATYFQTRHMQDYEPAQTTLLKGVGETADRKSVV